MPGIAELIFHSELESMRTRLGANGPRAVTAVIKMFLFAPSTQGSHYLVATLNALAAPQQHITETNNSYAIHTIYVAIINR